MLTDSLGAHGNPLCLGDTRMVEEVDVASSQTMRRAPGFQLESRKFSSYRLKKGEDSATVNGTANS